MKTPEDKTAKTATPQEDRWDLDHGPDHMREVIEEREDAHHFCRAGGGNNFHCGCKYDS
jgi:hypothetical protein